VRTIALVDARRNHHEFRPSKARPLRILNVATTSGGVRDPDIVSSVEVEAEASHLVVQDRPGIDLTMIR
jgi:hypothetical protein